ncbi:relaxase domain-containing protein [Tolypothrix sp. LEGE 11397]|uniref:MobF family relaxase n=1 Tax=Tolypothrix sp. LEGE 11397 TaxID=2777971 RepID=UPI001880993E|nr:MobF family relaxase [Tolypothrix sp. LEGE 11397]MBE9082862.1 relaxase domain-containing protein [Tolypothrix sp. LEGE 11397]
MNSIDIIRAGRESYYLTLGKDDYYTGQPETEGVFLGNGAKALRILGQQIKERDPTLTNLFDGFSPDGKTELRQGLHTTRAYHTLQDPETHQTVKTETGKTLYLSKYEVVQIKSGDFQKYSPRLQAIGKTHQINDLSPWLHKHERHSVVAYDNVLSAPKDVSILWSLAPDDKSRAEVLKIHVQATRKALSYLEEHTFIRTARGGTTLEPARATFAVFTHTTSRDLDPQLHSHALMLNIGITAQGNTGALDGKKVLESRYASGMIYQNELRRGLERTFGIETYDQPFAKDRGSSFGIAGISEAVKNEFSRRTQSIKQRVDPSMTAKQKRAEVLKTRKEKVLSLDNAALLKEWQERGKAQGFSWEKVVGKAKIQNLSTEQEYRLLYREVTSRLHKAEQNSEVRDQKILTTVASVARGRLSTDDVQKIALGIKTHFLKAHKQPNGRIIYTLNEKGFKAMHYRTAFERITDILKGLKKALYQNRLAVLYATGKISGAQYRKFTQGIGLPKSVIGIRTHQALGLISKRQADYLLYKKRNPTPVPTPKYRNTPITKVTIYEHSSPQNKEYER